MAGSPKGQAWKNNAKNFRQNFCIYPGWKIPKNICCENEIMCIIFNGISIAVSLLVLYLLMTDN